jgi:hypothetical protein
MVSAAARPVPRFHVEHGFRRRAAGAQVSRGTWRLVRVVQRGAR